MNSPDVTTLGCAAAAMGKGEIQKSPYCLRTLERVDIFSGATIYLELDRVKIEGLHVSA